MFIRIISHYQQPFEQIEGQCFRFSTTIFVFVSSVLFINLYNWSLVHIFCCCCKFLNWGKREMKCRMYMYIYCSDAIPSFKFFLIIRYSSDVWRLEILWKRCPWFLNENFVVHQFFSFELCVFKKLTNFIHKVVFLKTKVN